MVQTGRRNKEERGHEEKKEKTEEGKIGVMKI